MISCRSFQILTVLICSAAVALHSDHAVASEIINFDIERDLPTLGVWIPAAIIGLRFLAALSGVIPSSPLLFAAGATEGVVLGSIYVLIGAQLGAMTAFLIGRRLGRNFVERKGRMDRLAHTKIGSWLLDNETSQTRLMAAVFYCRLIPGVNLDGLSYVAGVTPIAKWRFCVATLGALLPYTVLLVAIGHQLVRLGSTGLAAALIAILAVGIIAPLWSRLS
jgi:uncharacterized membrane protein YdjX (TVP38/TMEM64 family)